MSSRKAERAATVNFTDDELSLVGGLLTVENSDYAACVLDEIQEHQVHAGPAATALAKVAEATEALAESAPDPRRVESVRGQAGLTAGQPDGDGSRALLWEARSDGGDHAPAMGTGVILMPVRAPESEEAVGWWHAGSERWALRRIAFGIRDLLQEATGDRSISVTVADRDSGATGDVAAGEPVWWCAHHGEEGTSWDGDEVCSGCHPDRVPALGPGPVCEAGDRAEASTPTASRSAAAENREER